MMRSGALPKSRVSILMAEFMTKQTRQNSQFVKRLLAYFIFSYFVHETGRQEVVFQICALKHILGQSFFLHINSRLKNQDYLSLERNLSWT